MTNSERNGWIGSDGNRASIFSIFEKHISFLDMLQCGERLRVELMKKATQRELKAILELCLNMNEGNLSLPKR